MAMAAPRSPTNSQNPCPPETLIEMGRRLCRQSKMKPATQPVFDATRMHNAERCIQKGCRSPGMRPQTKRKWEKKLGVLLPDGFCHVHLKLHAAKFHGVVPDWAFNRATRCTAMSKRARRRCKNPAMRGSNVCYFHGALGGQYGELGPRYRMSKRRKRETPPVLEAIPRRSAPAALPPVQPRRAIPQTGYVRVGTRNETPLYDEFKGARDPIKPWRPY
jgi:hypothetical protein